MRRAAAIAVILGALCPQAGGWERDWTLTALNRFAGEYNEFVRVYQSGVFDARRAKRLSALWRDVERSGWPREK